MVAVASMLIVIFDLFQMRAAFAAPHDPSCTTEVVVCGDGPDTDGDGLSDSYETTVSMTDPTYRDTDYDGPTDDIEWKRGWNPLVPDCDIDSSRCQVGEGKDTDGDFLSDSKEAKLGSNPYATDTDSDGLDDYEEYFGGEFFVTNINDPDTDGDGLSDLEEALHHTDPSVPDTDRDGFSDGEEVLSGTDPTDANSLPGLVAPESSLGSIAIVLSSMAALLAFVGFKIFGKRKP
jgi:hypothetical protein